MQFIVAGVVTGVDVRYKLKAKLWLNDGLEDSYQ